MSSPLPSQSELMKQWPRTITTLGLGAINLTIIDQFVSKGSESRLISPTPFGSLSSLSPYSLASFILLFLACYLVGVVVLFLGDYLSDFRETEEQRIMREIGVFNTQNPLLIRRYETALLRNDLIFGTLASWTLLWAISLIIFISSYQASTEPTNLGRDFMIFVVGNSIMFLLLLAARKPIEAIDKVLQRIETTDKLLQRLAKVESQVGDSN